MNVKLFHSIHKLNKKIIYLMKIEDSSHHLEYSSYYKTDLYIYVNAQSFISAGNIRELKKNLEPNIYTIKNLGNNDYMFGRIDLLENNNTDNDNSALIANMHTVQVTIETIAVDNAGSYAVSNESLKEWLPSNFKNHYNQYFPAYIMCRKMSIA